MSQNQIPNQKVLILDMDGVIIDSEPLHLKAYQTALAEFKVDYTVGQMREFLGRKDRECAAALVERFGLPVSTQELLQQKQEVCFSLIRQEGKCRPGLLELLREARDLGIACGIASSATLATIALVIDSLKIATFFQALTSGDEVLSGKPAPDIFLKAAERLATKPMDCLVFEDTATGITAAKAANMQCISVPCDMTRYQDHKNADLQLDSLAQFDLPYWLRAGRLRKLGSNLS